MNADEPNPYASPTTNDATPAPLEEDNEEKRRYRVAWMWGASGCGYLTLPWWVPPGPPLYSWVVLAALVASLGLSLVVFTAAVRVAQLGEPRDLIGALCGAFFGGCFIFFTAGAMLIETLLGIGVFL